MDALSVVIPVHNGAATLGEQLRAVVAAADDLTEVVVVDNRSTDASRQIAERFAANCPRVRVIAADHRLGAAHARNVGATAASGDLLAFCDSDDVIADEWPAAMREALRDAEYVTGPVDLDRLNPPWLASSRGRRFYAQLPRTVADIPFAHGCNVGIRRTTMQRVGGFDEQLRTGEDIDFAIRAWQQGIRLAWSEQAVVHYRLPRRAVDRWRQGMAYGRAAHHLHELVGEPWDVRRRVAAQVHRLQWLARTSPMTVRADHRARWLWTLASLVGEVRGRER